MIVFLEMTDASTVTVLLSRAQYDAFVADHGLYLEGGSRTWGQYRDLTGKVHHLEFAFILRSRTEALPDNHPLWGVR